MLFLVPIIFLLILCIALFWWGYSEGKSAGIREGRKNLADYVLSGGEQ